MAKNVSIAYTKLFINNEFVDSCSGATFPVINPATEDVIAHVAEARKDDVDKAVKAAQAAMAKDAPWRTMDASERGRLINKFADLIERDTELLAGLETVDNGKPFVDSLFDLEYTIKTIRYYAGWCDKIHGNTIPCDGSFICFTRKEPVGVVGQIIPWNFPAMMVAWKFGPALAAGCAIVLKPADLTPLSALHLAQLTKEAGIPAGVVNIVPGFGDTAGAAVAEHPGIDKVAFTGSTRVGHSVMKAAAESNLKRVTFELGGKSPIVVFDDCANLSEAVQTCHDALFANHGQNCCAGSRTYVQKGIYESFVQKATALAKRKVLGDPFDSKTEQGPQISKNQMTRILSYIEIGIGEGAKLECGGKRWGTKGFYVEPTVFSDVKDDMTIAREEIFGPVQVILCFDTLEEVIERANDTNYGLASGVITQNIDKAMLFAQSIKSGSVWINCYDVCLPQTPFGGYKQSGQGRELGEDGLLEYLETKTVTLKVMSKL